MHSSINTVTMPKRGVNYLHHVNCCFPSALSLIYEIGIDLI